MRFTCSPERILKSVNTMVGEFVGFVNKYQVWCQVEISSRSTQQYSYQLTYDSKNQVSLCHQHLRYTRPKVQVSSIWCLQLHHKYQVSSISNSNISIKYQVSSISITVHIIQYSQIAINDDRRKGTSILPPQNILKEGLRNSPDC